MQFLPVYEEVYHALEMQSLPHFLSLVSANVNRPKQLFWCVIPPAQAPLTTHEADRE